MERFSAGLTEMINYLDLDFKTFDEKKFLSASKTFFNTFKAIIEQLVFHQKPDLEMVIKEIKQGCNNLLKSGNFGTKICNGFNTWEKIKNPKETIISPITIKPLIDFQEKLKFDREFKQIHFSLIFEYLCDPKQIFGKNPQKNLNLVDVGEFFKKATKGQNLIDKKEIKYQVRQSINYCLEEINHFRSGHFNNPNYDLFIGNFIKMSEIKKSLFGKPTVVYARVAFFFDVDVWTPSFSLAIFSPTWHIEQKITIN